MSANTDPQPSTCTSYPWLLAQGKGEGSFQDGNTYVGKWLIFVARDEIDAVWTLVKRSTQQGQLGISSKVSTAAQTGYTAAQPSRHVICVYTRDFRDTSDVARVLNGLRQVGITGTLYFKTDQATLAGQYRVDSPFTRKKGRSSLYSSLDFEGEDR